MMNLVPAEGVGFDPRDVDMYEGLTGLQNAYIYWRQMGFTPMQAAKRTGYSAPKSAARDNERNPAIRGVIEQIEEDSRVRFKVDRDRVVEGIMEALSVARESSDPKVMLQAWVEMARITGVQAPEVKKIEVQGDVTQHHISHASDTELLEMVGKKRELQLPAIEGEYEDVTDVEE